MMFGRNAGPSPVPAAEAVAFGDRLLRDRDAVAVERDEARAALEAIRVRLGLTSYFAGVRVDDVVMATDLLATAYEAERSRP